jgi:hypothetical protein
MNIDETPSERDIEIRLYLLGKQPLAEKAAVEARIAQDAEYANAVQEMRWKIALAHVARTAQEREEERAQVSDAVRAQVKAAAQRAQAQRSQGFRRTIYLSAAAAVALLAAFGAYFWLRPPLHKRLYKEYFALDAPWTITQGSGTDKGFVHYRDQEYKAAIASLSRVTPDDSLYAEARFYLAQSHLAQQETAAAVAVLEALLQVPMKEILLHKTTWYLALGYLDLGKVDEAKVHLQALSGLEGDPLQAKARAILEALR